jgi:hypothetical protein
MSSELPGNTPSEPNTGPGMSRRGLLRGAAGLGVAGVAAGLLVNGGGTAAAATVPATADHEDATHVPSSGDPVVAHVRDARTGDIDLFVGTRHVQFRDRELASRITKAAH